MKTTQHRRRRLSALLLIPVMVVLSGCMKFHMDVDIRSEDDALMTMEIVDELGFLELAEEGCDEFSDDVNEAKVEQFTDDEGNFGCRISGNIGGSVDEDGFWITQDGNELVFKLFNLDAGMDDGDLGLDEEIDLDDPMMQMFAPDIKVSVTFPGKVTYASSGGEIDGKTVTWSGMEVFSMDIEARGEAKGGLFGGGGKNDAETEDADQGSAETEGEETVEPDEGETAEPEDAPAADDEASEGDDVATSPSDKADDSDKSGLPLWVVGLLGLLLLLVIFLIVVVARRGRGDTGGGGTDQFPPQQPQYQGQQFPQQGQQYPPQAGQYPPQHGQYPPQQQWDQTQQMPQEWGQTQQFPQQGQSGQWNDGGQPPTQ